MTVTIKLPDGKQGITPVHGTRVYTETGAKVQDISRIRLDWQADQVAEATFDIALKPGTTLENVHVLLGTETLEQIAEMHGYTLTPIEGSE